MAELPSRFQLNNPFPLPTCAICKRPVERISRVDLMHRAATIFVVECHGDREEVTLTAIQMVEWFGPGSTLTMGEAFVPKALPPAPLALPGASPTMAATALPPETSQT
jgi:hypothetical protein